MADRKKRSLLLMAFLGLAAAVICSCVFSTHRVQSRTMEPSVTENSIILINRMAYFYQEPEAGDVVAFHCNVYSGDGEGSVLIRRVAATEGDRVEITGGRLYINGELYEEYSQESIWLDPMDEVTVGADRVFVLSDSRTAVLDSRNQAVGQLRTDELDGKVCFR